MMKKYALEVQAEVAEQLLHHEFGTRGSHGVMAIAAKAATDKIRESYPSFREIGRVALA